MAIKNKKIDISISGNDLKVHIQYNTKTKLYIIDNIFDMNGESILYTLHKTEIYKNIDLLQLAVVEAYK